MTRMCFGGGKSRPTPQPDPAPAPPPPTPAPDTPLQSATRIQERRTRNQARETRRTGPGGVTRFGGSSFAPVVFGSTGTPFV